MTDCAVDMGEAELSDGGRSKPLFCEVEVNVEGKGAGLGSVQGSRRLSRLGLECLGCPRQSLESGELMAPVPVGTEMKKHETSSEGGRTGH
ncbi:hypothetical protein MLD38_000362 [Melastoma candidum]|uniref:Uncharacterized protein n=1 Tax=Melastoma candidum TaxID=119954 RepID=A0ACB9SIF4_9MYRT|nr:hypothetical protein MLD38_000362 [Melastoma candidum]